MIGKRILSYEIKSLIGEGGMANVYLAEHITTGQKVAIKSSLPHLARYDSIRERFRMEADTLSRLPHPHIVKLVSYKEDPEGAYIIMEYLEGTDLSKYIKTQSGPMTVEQSSALMKQILDAIGFAHKQHVIHRDIKPSNIILTKDKQIKLIDFGIAKVLSEADRKLTKTGLQMGAVFYMSPEQVKGKTVDKRSDIYSLGVTFFQMVSGQSPYESMTTEFEVYSKIVSEPLPSALEFYPAAHQPFDKVIAKATAKDPNFRYEDCEQFADALTKAITDTTSSNGGDKGKGGTGGNDPDGGKGRDGTQTTTFDKTGYGVWIALTVIVLLLIIITGTWQCNVKSQYSKLMSSAKEKYEAQDFTGAIGDYEQAAKKRKSLFIGKGNDDPEASISECNFEIYKRRGEEELRNDKFTLDDSPDYKFKALEDFNTARLYKFSGDSIDQKISLCNYIKDAMDNYNSNNYPGSLKAYNDALSYAFVIGERPEVIGHLTDAKEFVAKPTVFFKNIYVEDNVYDYDLNDNLVKGMKIHVKMQTKFLYGNTCRIVAWFYYTSGTPIQDDDGNYRATDNQVSSGKSFTPTDDSELFSDFVIFMPYAELELYFSGDYKFLVGLVFNGTNTVNSDYVTFHYNSTY